MLQRQVGVSATAGPLTCVPSGDTEALGQPQSCRTRPGRASHKIVRRLTGQRARVIQRKGHEFKTQAWV